MDLKINLNLITFIKVIHLHKFNLKYSAHLKVIKQARNTNLVIAA